MWGKSRYEEGKERWQAMSKRERKDRGQVRDAHQGIQVNGEARGKETEN